LRGTKAGLVAAIRARRAGLAAGLAGGAPGVAAQPGRPGLDHRRGRRLVERLGERRHQRGVGAPGRAVEVDRAQGAEGQREVGLDPGHERERVAPELIVALVVAVGEAVAIGRPAPGQPELADHGVAVGAREGQAVDLEARGQRAVVAEPAQRPRELGQVPLRDPGLMGEPIATIREVGGVGREVGVEGIEPAVGGRSRG
jgi:hypothetical protein